MVQLTVKLSDPGALQAHIARRMQVLQDGEREARAKAAAVANRTTQSTFGAHMRPSDAPPRKGRRHRPDNMLPNLVWTAGRNSREAVAFDLARADKNAQYWVIQEIGTGAQAVMHRAGEDGGVTRTVRSQYGRRIAASLAFGTSPTGEHTEFGDATGQQLYLRKRLGAPLLGQRGFRGATISKEIEARHMVARGATEGFREYETAVLAAARRAFNGSGRRP